MSPPTPTAVMLVSGEYFDPFAPDPSVITLDVLAAGMRNPRFKAQTPRLISIGEHSMRVRRIARELVGVGIHTEILALVHDAHEPLSPWVDMPSPWKDDRIRALEVQLDRTIAVALDLPEFSDDEREIVKTADAIALYFEALWWQPGARDWATHLVEWRQHPGDDAQTEVERFMPLIAPRPGECWRTEVEALLGVRCAG